jgi:hypothetical protein
MALLGGGIGGAGQAISGSFTGPAQALEIIGKHVYAYSGALVIGQTAVTMLEFTSGPYYSVVNVSFSVTRGAGGGTDNYELAIEMNGSAVMHSEIGSPAGAEGPLIQFDKLLIPPYTEVKMTGSNRSQDVDHDCFLAVAGRRYQ